MNYREAWANGDIEAGTLVDRIDEQAREIERLKAGQESLILVRDDYKRQAGEYRTLWSKAVVKPRPHGLVLPERDDVIRKAVGMCNRIPGSTTWNAAEYAYDEFVARLNSSPVSAGVKLPDDFVCDSKPLQDLLNATAMLLETPCPDSATYWAAMLANVEALLKPISAGGVDERAAFEVEIPNIAATYDGLYLTPMMPLKAGEHLMTVTQHLRIEKQLRAALSTPNHSEQARHMVREGWQLVPKVATRAMKNAIWAELDRQGFDSDLVETQSLYCAGIAAAPSAGSQGGDV